MLLLTRIDDGLRSKLVEHPAHPAELRSRQREHDPLSFDLGFHSEMAPLRPAIVKHDVAHNPSVKACQHRRLQAGLPTFYPDKVGAASLVPGCGESLGAEFLVIPVWVFVVRPE